MRLLFYGVGEACDPEHGNTSFQVTAANGTTILCDCGFSIPHSYFGRCTDPGELDLVWLSHFHGDHFFGMPLLLLRLWEMGRTKPLVVAGQEGTGEKVTQAMELAFPGFGDKLAFEVRFEVVEPGSTTRVCGLDLQAVETIHSQRNLGLFLDDGAKKLYYSGDGRPSDSVLPFIEQCDIAVHEAFMLDDEFPYHGSITGCLSLFKACSPCTMVLVHLERTFRRDSAQTIATYQQQYPNLLFPVTGDSLEV